MVAVPALTVVHSLEQYQSSREQAKSLIGTMKSKNFIKQEPMYKYYVKYLERLLNEETCSERMNLLTLIKKEARYQMVEKTRKYEYNLLKFEYDEVNLLDKAGLAKYSRNYQIVYSIEDKLAEILSSLFNAPLTDVKKNLTNNFLKQGLHYTTGSTAIVSNYTASAEALTQAWCLNLHEKIDDMLSKTFFLMTEDKITDIFQDEILLSELPQNNSVRFGVMLSTFVNKYSYSIILQMLEQLRTVFDAAGTKQFLITSMGVGNIVINSHEKINVYDYNIKVGLSKDVEFIVTPTLSEKGEYFFN